MVRRSPIKKPCRRQSFQGWAHSGVCPCFDPEEALALLTQLKLKSRERVVQLFPYAFSTGTVPVSLRNEPAPRFGMGEIKVTEGFPQVNPSFKTPSGVEADPDEAVGVAQRKGACPITTELGCCQ